MESENKRFSAFKARILLMFGGPLGLHLLYLHEPLEAYIYFATFGVLLFGIFYDTLTLANRITAENREMQFLFGCWIGFLFCLAAVLLVGIEHRLLLALSIAAGVTQGVYVVGNCRKQERSIIYIALPAVLSSVMALFLFDISLYRTLLFTSLSATFVGNRVAQVNSVRTFSRGSYFVLSSIHFFIVVIIIVGLTRILLDRRISVVTGNSYSRITSSLGSIILDRYFRNPRRDVFRDATRIEYLAPERAAVLSGSWELFWFPQIRHQVNAEKYSVFDYIVVFIVDFMRYSTALSKETVKDGVNALQLAMWRIFTLQLLDIGLRASDEQVEMECLKFLKRMQSTKVQEDITHWRYRGVKKACELLHQITKRS